MTKKLLKVRVNRAKWLTGRVGLKRGTGSVLYSGSKETKGMMCCLGFACRVAGLTPKQIRGRGLPDSVRAVDNFHDDAATPRDLKLIDSLVAANLVKDVGDRGRAFYSSDHILELTKHNDETHISHADREDLVIKEGKKRGFLFSFYGKYPKDVAKEPEE